jgi:hypothetical protein
MAFRNGTPHVIYKTEAVEAAMIEAGAVAFVHKEAALEQLYQTIQPARRSTVRSRFTDCFDRPKEKAWSVPAVYEIPRILTSDKSHPQETTKLEKGLSRPQKAYR